MYCDFWLQCIKVQKLFKEGNYSRAKTICGNSLLLSLEWLCVLILRQKIMWLLATPRNKMDSSLAGPTIWTLEASNVSKMPLLFVLWWTHLTTYLLICQKYYTLHICQHITNCNSQFQTHFTMDKSQSWRIVISILFVHTRCYNS